MSSLGGVSAQVQFQQSYFYDESSNLTIDEVSKLDFQPFNGDLRQGIFDGSTWIKVKISKTKDFEKISQDYSVFPLVIGIGTFNLDHIVVYESVNGIWSTQEVDHIHLQRPRICNDDLHCFNLKTHLINPEVEEIYVKIDTQTFRSVHIEVRSQNTLASSSISRVFRISSALSFGFCLFILALLMYFMERSRFLLAFALFELTIVSYLYTSSGINYNIFDFHLHFFTYSLSLTFFNIRLMLFIWLCRLAIANYSPSSLYCKFSNLLQLCSCVCLLLPIVSLRALSLEVNLSIQVLVVLLNIYGVFSCFKIPLNIKSILLFGYFTYLFLFLFALIYSIGWVELGFHRYIGFQNFYDFRLNGMPIGVVVFSIVIIQVLTSKKESYQALAEAEINRAKVFYLNDKIKERENMAEILSHEVKNPLSTIRFASNSIQNSVPIGSDIHSRAMVINRSASRIDDLINQVYLSNQLDNKIFQKAISRINLYEFFIEVIGEFNAIHRFNLNIPNNLTFQTNEFLMYTIFTNLISNSIKYAKSSTLINIRVDVKDKSLLEGFNFLASNNDELFPKVSVLLSNEVDSTNLPDPDKVFNRYYRHENFLAKPGMGIGLNIVKSAVDLLNGEIAFSVSSSTVSFTVEIPLS